MEEASGSNSQGTQLFSREQQQWLASFIGGITRGPSTHVEPTLDGESN